MLHSEPVTERLLTAQEYWDHPPVTAGEILEGQRRKRSRKTDHESYMDFAELYGDYVAHYEKMFDYQRGTK